MNKVYTIGEALIDFIPDQKNTALKDVQGFQRVPGGAPANVAAGIARLGGNSAFIGKVGEDAFGQCIIECLADCGVETQYIFTTKEANTALAFVTLDEHGDRDFAFYRNPAADMLLNENEIDSNWFKPHQILHFGSVDLIDAPVKKAHEKAIDSAREQGCLISFDPNVRLPLWPSPEACRTAILEFIPKADLLKISDDELPFITNISSEEEAIASLFVGHVKTIVLTLGSQGSRIYTKEHAVFVESVPVKAVDTTGAGDAFVAALLYQLALSNSEPHLLSAESLKKILQFSNTAGAIATQTKGAIAALPTLKQIVSQIG